MKGDKYIGIIGGVIIIIAGLLIGAVKQYSFITGVYLGFGICLIAFNKGIAGEINSINKNENRKR